MQRQGQKFSGVTNGKLHGKFFADAVATWADVSYTVGLLGRFASNPSAGHWDGTKRLLQYLRGTTEKELCLGI